MGHLRHIGPISLGGDQLPLIIVICHGCSLFGELGEESADERIHARFDSGFAGAAEQNLQNEELRLKKLLGDAETKSREKAQQKIALYGDLVRHKQQTISNFDRLAVTALRRHFSDDELARAFRILNFELLETPLGDDGITVRSEERVLALVRVLATRVKDGIYDDEITHVAAARTAVRE